MEWYILLSNPCVHRAKAGRTSIAIWIVSYAGTMEPSRIPVSKPSAPQFSMLTHSCNSQRICHNGSHRIGSHFLQGGERRSRNHLEPGVRRRRPFLPVPSHTVSLVLSVGSESELAGVMNKTGRRINRVYADGYFAAMVGSQGEVACGNGGDPSNHE